MKGILAAIFVVIGLASVGKAQVNLPAPESQNYTQVTSVQRLQVVGTQQILGGTFVVIQGFLHVGGPSGPDILEKSSFWLNNADKSAQCADLAAAAEKIKARFFIEGYGSSTINGQAYYSSVTFCSVQGL